MEAVVISDMSLVDKEFLATVKNLGVLVSSFLLLRPLCVPNGLENPRVSNRMCTVIVEEAHCISKW